MRIGSVLVVALSGVALASAAAAQTWADPSDNVGDLMTRLERQDQFQQATGQGPTFDVDQAFIPHDSDAFTPVQLGERGLVATTRRDVWREGPTYTDRLSLTTRGDLRRADGSPLPATPADELAIENADYDVSYVRGFPAARGYTASGLEVTVTPHAGLALGSRGGSAEAGATVKIGRDLDNLVPDGVDRFGERGRWYIYAAGSGRAVGYNFARTRDGDFARSGYSHDAGSFLGDASLGVAWRKGDMQSSFGLVYREVEIEGRRFGPGVDRDVDEGLVAFQLSIKPD